MAVLCARAKVRKVHALLVDDFNAEHGLRTRSAAAGRLARSRSALGAPQQLPCGEVAQVVPRGNVLSAPPLPATGRVRPGAKESATVDDGTGSDEGGDMGCDASGSGDGGGGGRGDGGLRRRSASNKDGLLHGYPVSEFKPSGSRRKAPVANGSWRVGQSSPGLWRHENSNHVEDEGSNNALVIGALSPNSKDAAAASLGVVREELSRSELRRRVQVRADAQAQRGLGSSDSRSSWSSPGAAASDAGAGCDQPLPPPPAAPEDQAAWAAVGERVATLPLAELRRALQARGVDVQTPGVRGAPRHHTLTRRLLGALRAAAEQDGAAASADKAAFFGEGSAPGWGAEGRRQLQSFLECPTAAPPVWHSQVPFPWVLNKAAREAPSSGKSEINAN